MEQRFIEIQEYGPAETLKVATKELSADLKADEVLIDVKFSGINFADIYMRLGMYKDAPPKPFVPGYECSGIVLAVGSDVTRLQVGDKVMAGSVFGSYVSKIKLPSFQVLKLPEHLTLEQGAATPVNYLTSYIALHEFARIRKGDKVLIDCATGGVGVFCLQMAFEVGCETIGLTTSAHKKEFIESYGARAMTHDEFYAGQEKNFDFILNSSAGKAFRLQYHRLGMSGKITCIGMGQSVKDGKSSLVDKLKLLFQTPWYPLFQLMMQSKAVSGFNALNYFDEKEWMEKRLLELEKCPYKAYVDKIFPADEVASAHAHLEQKKAKGKVLISW